ncbi:hypothetical protein AB5N96_11665 [Chryseomicrobium imtechense]
MASYEAFLDLPDLAEYKKVFEEEYCNQEVFTFDGIKVGFHPDMFEHAFYKNANRRKGDKSIFCFERAKRMRWIRKVLLDDDLTIYQGWDSKKKAASPDRRVCLVTPDGYVVIIALNRKNNKYARFITAYICDDVSVINKVKSNPIIYRAKSFGISET